MVIRINANRGIQSTLKQPRSFTQNRLSSNPQPTGDSVRFSGQPIRWVRKVRKASFEKSQEVLALQSELKEIANADYGNIKGIQIIRSLVELIDAQFKDADKALQNYQKALMVYHHQNLLKRFFMKKPQQPLSPLRVDHTDWALQLRKQVDYEGNGSILFVLPWEDRKKLPPRFAKDPFFQKLMADNGGKMPAVGMPISIDSHLSSIGIIEHGTSAQGEGGNSADYITPIGYLAMKLLLQNHAPEAEPLSTINAE